MFVPTNTGVENIKLVKMIAVETGTYDDAYLRPYSYNITEDAVNSIANRVYDNGGLSIGAAMLSGGAFQILAPTSTPVCAIGIANGWGAPRVRFMLEVEVGLSIGATHIYYFQGYTDYNGITKTAIDPNMEFTINSYLAVNRYITNHNGVPYVMDAPIGNGQLIQSNSGVSSILQPDAARLMRPADIAKGMQSSYISSTMNGTGSYDSRNVVTSEPKVSKRSNTVPTNYISNLADNYINCQRAASMGQSNNSILTSLISTTNDTMAGDIPFLRRLANIRGMNGSCCKFFLRDLLQIDPTFIARIKTAVIEGSARQVYNRGTAQHWGGQDYETVAGFMIVNAVPGLMVDTMLTRVSFIATNKTGQLVFTPIDAKSLTTMDITPYLSTFRSRFINEVLNDVTYNNQVMYEIHADFDLYGETRLNISLNGGPLTPYVHPSFCDQLASPVIAPNQQFFNSAVHNIDSLLSVVSEAAKQSSQQLGFNHTL